MATGPPPQQAPPLSPSQQAPAQQSSAAPAEEATSCSSSLDYYLHYALESIKYYVVGTSLQAVAANSTLSAARAVTGASASGTQLEPAERKAERLREICPWPSSLSEAAAPLESIADAVAEQAQHLREQLMTPPPTPSPRVVTVTRSGDAAPVSAVAAAAAAAEAKAAAEVAAKAAPPVAQDDAPESPRIRRPGKEPIAVC